MEPTKDIKNTLQEHYDTLPNALQYAVSSNEVREMLVNLKQEHGLTDQEDVVLSNEVFFILFGISEREDFKNNLISEGIEREKSETLNNEIQTEIFDPLKEELSELFKEEEGNDAPQIKTQERIVQESSTQTQTNQNNTPAENKDEILHDIEEPKSFEVPFKKTVFEEKLDRSTPETKEEMLNELKTLAKNTQEKEAKNHNLFPQPNKEVNNGGGGDPYREQI